MSEKKIDLRIKRTKETIMKTFKDMIMEMDLSEICIKELTERAGINRKTFYLHYSDINDLINHFQEAMLEQLMDYAHKSIKNKDPYAIIKDSLHFYARDAELNYKLFSRIDLHLVSNNYFEKANVPLNISGFVPGTKYPYIASVFMSSAVQNIFCSWYANGQQIPIDELADYATELIFRGVDMKL